MHVRITGACGSCKRLFSRELVSKSNGSDIDDQRESNETCTDQTENPVQMSTVAGRTPVMRRTNTVSTHVGWASFTAATYSEHHA